MAATTPSSSSRQSSSSASASASGSTLVCAATQYLGFVQCDTHAAHTPPTREHLTGAHFALGAPSASISLAAWVWAQPLALRASASGLVLHDDGTPVLAFPLARVTRAHYVGTVLYLVLPRLAEGNAAAAVLPTGREHAHVAVDSSGNDKNDSNRPGSASSSNGSKSQVSTVSSTTTTTAASTASTACISDEEVVAATLTATAAADVAARDSGRYAVHALELPTQREARYLANVITKYNSRRSMLSRTLLKSLRRTPRSSAVVAVAATHSPERGASPAAAASANAKRTQTHRRRRSWGVPLPFTHAAALSPPPVARRTWLNRSTPDGLQSVGTGTDTAKTAPMLDDDDADAAYDLLTLAGLADTGVTPSSEIMSVVASPPSRSSRGAGSGNLGVFSKSLHNLATLGAEDDTDGYTHERPREEDVDSDHHSDLASSMPVAGRHGLASRLGASLSAIPSFFSKSTPVSPAQSAYDLRPVPAGAMMSFAAFMDKNTPSTLTSPTSSRVASDDDNSADEEESDRRDSYHTKRAHHYTRTCRSSASGSRGATPPRPTSPYSGPQLADNDTFVTFEPDLSGLLGLEGADEWDNDAYNPDSAVGQTLPEGCSVTGVAPAEEEGPSTPLAAAAPRTLSPVETASALDHDSQCGQQGQREQGEQEEQEEQEEQDDEVPVGFGELELQPWFLGAVPVAAAQTQLEAQGVGTFALVERSTDTEAFVLVLRTHSGCRCLHVARHTDGSFQLAQHPQCFASIAAVAAFAAEDSTETMADGHAAVTRNKRAGGAAAGATRLVTSSA